MQFNRTNHTNQITLIIMKTITESKLISKRGCKPYSISLNDCDNNITPFSTHIKVYTEEGHFFESGDYCYNLTDAMESFASRCNEYNTQELGS